MSTDLANLQIRVQSLEAEVADRRLQGLARSGDRAERATDGLTATIKRLAGPLVAAASATAALMKVVDVTKEFGVLNAQLITATGSAESAGVAFEAIQDFATKTPYDLQQVTEAFTKLVNYGLTPSERALESYGNTASAMGKDLIQFIEAVADASTGEFERLKEFGIKSSKEGDKVTFTFRGMKETVKFEAGAIEEYLTRLGEVNFAGAMETQMDSLGGALSNLGDEWDKLWLNISNQGIGNIIEDAVRLGIDVLEELNAMLASGQLVATIEAFFSKFSGYWTDIQRTATDALEIMTGVFEFAMDNWGEEISDTVDFIKEAFELLPENFRTIIQLMTVELASFVHSGLISAKAFVQVMVNEFDGLVEKAKFYGKALAIALNPLSDEDPVNITSGFAAIDQEVASRTAAIYAEAEREKELFKQGRLESIEAILAEREAALSSTKDQFDAAKALREEYDRLLEERRAATGDRLEGFGVGATSEDGPSDAEKKAADKAAKRLAKLQERREAVMRSEFDSLLGNLKSEEQAIQDSYNRRMAIIIANTEEGSTHQMDLLKKLNEQFEKEALGDLAQPDTYEEQIQALQEYYERRRQLILENVGLTEEERTTLETELTEQRNQKLAQLEGARMSQILSTGEQVFDGLAGLAKTFAGEQSGVYRAMFAVSKAFAIADAIVKIQQGIAAAAALPWPANLGAMASVAAATSGIVATISGTQFSGAYDEGGHIPSGKIGLVGEYGPELVQGPANVTSRKETAKMLENAQQGGEAQVIRPEVKLRVNNLFDTQVLGDYLGSDDGEEVLNNWARKNQDMFKSFSTGTG